MLAPLTFLTVYQWPFHALKPYERGPVSGLEIRRKLHPEASLGGKEVYVCPLDMLSVTLLQSQLETEIMLLSNKDSPDA